VAPGVREARIGLGGGCHWCTEAVFAALRSVTAVEQGFIRSDPPHEAFAEAVVVAFDPEALPLEVLIEVHLRTHSSASAHKLRGKYRSAVYAFDEAQGARARVILADLQPGFDRPLVTRSSPSPASARPTSATAATTPGVQTAPSAAPTSSPSSPVCAGSSPPTPRPPPDPHLSEISSRDEAPMATLGAALVLTAPPSPDQQMGGTMSRPIGVPVVGAPVRAQHHRDAFEAPRPAAPGETYRLPPCCLKALGASSTRGTLMATIGARLSAAGQISINWDQETALHGGFTTGVVPGSGSLYDLVQAHAAVHAREPASEAGKFWSKLLERKKARMRNARNVDMFER
jgi:peptide methionine sulfoxide reductase MsrA